MIARTAIRNAHFTPGKRATSQKSVCSLATELFVSIKRVTGVDDFLSVSEGHADLVYPALRRGSRRASYSNPEWAEVGKDSEGEYGRKPGDVGERDRVETFCGKCGNM